MPPVPLDAVYLCTQILMPLPDLPPYSHKTILPPLSHFLDDGLYIMGGLDVDYYLANT